MTYQHQTSQMDTCNKEKGWYVFDALKIEKKLV